MTTPHSNKTRLIPQKITFRSVINRENFGKYCLFNLDDMFFGNNSENPRGLLDFLIIFVAMTQ